mgnify:CR=1 FL=1
MKKILIFVLAAVLSLAMLFSVTACGDSEVVDPVTVTISQETASVEVGSTVTLTATASDESAITWSSSDTDVATVSGGVVTGVSAGTATITATSGDATATCTVTVTKTEDPTEEVTITISQETASVEVGSTVTLTATASDESAITWSSSDTDVATVSGGVVTGVSAGTATITATSGDAKATCAITVVEAGGVDPTGEPLQAPTIAIEGKELTITDTNTEGVSSYTVNIIDKSALNSGVTAGTVVRTLTAKDKTLTINDIGLAAGEYDVQAKAVGGSGYADSELSESVAFTVTATTSYEVPLTDENTSVKMVGQWQYWSEIANDAALTDTVTDCAYDNGSVSFTMDQTNAVNWYATQFFYDVFGIENKQNYTVTMKITVTDLTIFDGAEAGKITVNGTEFTLVEGENDIEVTRAYNTNKAAVSVQMGIIGDTPLTVKSGAFVISDITIA